MSLARILPAGANRIPYDIDGTTAFTYRIDGTGIKNPVSAAGLTQLNNESNDSLIYLDTDYCLAFLFPAKQLLTSLLLSIAWSGDAGDNTVLVEYSVDTTDGRNGTWAHLHFPNGFPGVNVIDSYRVNIQSYAQTTVKAIRINGRFSTYTLQAVHLYSQGNPGPQPFQINDPDVYLGDVAAAGAPYVGQFVIQNNTTIKRTFTLDFDVLTDIVNPGGFGTSLYLSTIDSPDWHGGISVDVPANGGVTTVEVLSVLPPGLANKLVCARVRFKAAGLNYVARYIFVDSIGVASPPEALIVDAEPPEAQIGVDPLFVKTVGAGATQATHDANFAYNTHLGFETVPPWMTVDGWTEVGPSDAAFTGARQISSQQIDPEHQEIVLAHIPAGTPQAAGTVELYYGPGDMLTATFVDSSPLGVTAAVVAPSAGGGGGPGNEAQAIGSFRHRNVSGILRYPWPPQDDWGPLPVGYVPSSHPQRLVQATPADYMVRDGVPVRPPALGANCNTVAYAKSFSSEVGLQDAVAAGSLGADARWLPDTADLFPRTDIAADVSGWRPHFGAAPDFIFHSASAPFVDPGYSYYAGGQILKQNAAMVFPGGAWVERNGGDIGPFAWMIVALLHHPPAASWYDILASPSAQTDPVRATDAAIRYDNGSLVAYCGARLSKYDLSAPLYKGRIRPTIIGWSESYSGGSLYVLDGLGTHQHDYAHKQVPSFDGRFWFGVNGAIQSAGFSAVFDVLEVLFWGERLTAAGFRSVAPTLNRLYGVTGR